MKVIDALDNIYFNNGDRTSLLLLERFAGDEGAEIFGLGRHRVFNKEEIRYLIANPVRSNSVLQRYNLYLGDERGNLVKLGDGKYLRDEVFAIYGDILTNTSCKDLIRETEINSVGRILTQHIESAQKESVNATQKGE